MEVTSVSRRQQQLKDAAAAVYVITREDIRRSGVTSIPEALRMAPGVQVARINANKWAVSARGFNSQWANKLLVLFDGRSIYGSPFSGVYWEMQDYVIDDIERIEVIRGPGATLWGSNAVNGIINIITRSAEQTLGGVATVTVGNERKTQTELRYGRVLGERAEGRVYFKFQNSDSFKSLDRDPAADDSWDSMQAGFRIDGRLGDNDDWTLQGDIFDLDANQYIALFNQPTPPYEVPQNDSYNAGGWNVLGRWHHRWNATDNSTLQIYFDHSQRDELILGTSHNTVDIDFQHAVALGERHQLIAGLGYRHVKDKFENSYTLSLNPDRLSQNLYSGFLQDEITLVAKRLFLTIGSKLEHNRFTGLEVQPSARLLWAVDEHHTLWTAVSRAVRIPARIENHMRLISDVVPLGPPPAPPLEIALNGNPRQDSEEVISYELGYRLHAHENFSLDIATFYNDYDRLQSYRTGVPAVRVDFGNDLRAQAYGAEVSVDWRPLDWWRLQPNYTYMRVSSKIDTGITDVISESLREGSNPEHQFSVRSAMDFGPDWDFDVWVYHVGRLSDLGSITKLDVPAYTSLSLRLAWAPAPGVELSVSGHNLLERSNLEFVGESYLGQVEIDRSVIGQLRWEW